MIPFQMSCGHCFMCNEKLYSQCEVTQVREQGTGAALFGFSKLYGEVPGGSRYLRVPMAQTTHIKVPDGPPDDRFVFLSDVLPTAWQSVQYAGIPDGGTVAVLGLGPIGDMAARIAQHLGYRVIAVDLVPERLARAQARGIETVDLAAHEKDLSDASATSPTGGALTRSLMPSGWRPTARRPRNSSRPPPGSCPTLCRTTEQNRRCRPHERFLLSD